MDLFTITVTDPRRQNARKLHQAIAEAWRELHIDSEMAQLDVQEYEHYSYIWGIASLPHFQLTVHGPDVLRATSEGIAGYILDEMETTIVRGIISREYDYKDHEDLDTMIQYCLPQLDPSKGDPLAEHARKIRRRKISDAVYEYISEHTEFVLEGFVNFRMQDYVEELREIAEYAVDEYLMEKQYQEFISLLKYFVYIQDAKIPIAHLIHKGEHEFTLLNEQMEPIETKQLDGFVVEMVDKEINYEDMIVSTLISVSPHKVHIHTREPEAQVIKTIEQIFEDRATTCTDCAMCTVLLGEHLKHVKDHRIP